MITEGGRRTHLKRLFSLYADTVTEEKTPFFLVGLLPALVSAEGVPSTLVLGGSVVQRGGVMRCIMYTLY